MHTIDGINQKFRLTPGQNCRQNLVNANRWALRLCGGHDIQIWQKFQQFIAFHISIWGGLKLCLGG